MVNSLRNYRLKNIIQNKNQWKYWSWLTSFKANFKAWNSTTERLWFFLKVKNDGHSNEVNLSFFWRLYNLNQLNCKQIEWWLDLLDYTHVVKERTPYKEDKHNFGANKPVNTLYKEDGWLKRTFPFFPCDVCFKKSLVVRYW